MENKPFVIEGVEIDVVTKLYMEGKSCFDCANSHLLDDDLVCELYKEEVDEHDVCEDWKE